MVPTFFQDQFIDAIDDGRSLLVDKVIECYLADPHRLGVDHDLFFADLQDRFARLIIKAFVETAESDLVWSRGEAVLAQALVEHLLGQQVKKSKIKEAFAQLSVIAKRHSWANVLEPVTWYEEMVEHYEAIKTAIVKVANIAAKVDGHASAETITQLKAIRWQLDQHLPTLMMESGRSDGGKLDQDDAFESDAEPRLSDVLIRLVKKDAGSPKQQPHAAQPLPDPPELETPERRAAQLEKGLAELEALIGMKDVKHEVQTLINLCKLRQHRAAHAMPASPVSLHTVFTGNPGTGKTTVARIMGKLLGAMGIIARGHLVETDRAGLVAEYLGQTAQKTNAKIDEALDGVLFIDEAYSLAPASQPDVYGQEAIQTLLKRMEDDRERLVVILAGYPQPMTALLRSNPGLLSRFSRRCHFPDYDTDELCAIFEKIAEQNHYQTTDVFRKQLTAEIQRQVDTKDDHFGNGRMVRNLFENAIRNLANRVVQATDLTPDLLSTFQPQDLGYTAAVEGSIG